MSSLTPLFRPRSVAIVGASTRPKSVGFEVVANLLRSGFHGPLYPVNPKARAVHSIPAYPSLSAIPAEIDLAVITVPRDHVLPVIEEAIRKGVKALVTISAGFKEVDEEGARLEELIAQRLTESGVRMVGPNCMGLLNTNPDVRLNASFTAASTPSGGIAVASQSGALGETILKTAGQLGLGISSFVSLGNKTDVGGNDLIEYWADDEQTNLILLYLESFGDPKRFAQVARHVTHNKGKPILAVKSGRSKAGATAAASHTGSLAGADVAVDSLLQQCGVIRVDTVAELFTIAQGFAHQPIPRGRRLGILTNAGGLGIMATDAAVHFDLELAQLTEDTKAKLRATLAPEASVRNPVDTIATAGATEYQSSIETMYCDPNVDALIVIFVSPVMIDPPGVARAIVAGVEAAKRRSNVEKPVLSCFMGKHHGDEGIAILHSAQIPVFAFPEAAAESLSAMARFGELRAQEPGKVPQLAPAPRKELAKEILDNASPGWLGFADVMKILAAYAIPTAQWAIVATPDAAVSFALEVGYPIVLKIDSDTLLHKTEHGAVKINLRNEEDVLAAYTEIQNNISDIAGQHNFVAQKMLHGQVETLVGATLDPAFGHLVGFGLGGIFAEQMKDVVFRLAPLTDRDASLMIQGIRGYALLQGARGTAAVDCQALADVLLRVSQLVEDFPIIEELDLNPFLAHASADQQAAVDARMRIVPKVS